MMNKNQIVLNDFLENSSIEATEKRISTINKIELLRRYSTSAKIYLEKEGTVNPLFERIIEVLNEIDKEHVTMFNLTLLRENTAFGLIYNEEVVFYSGIL